MTRPRLSWAGCAFVLASAFATAAAAQQAPAAPAWPEPEPDIAPPPFRPDRSGFTLELGLGLAITHVMPDGGDSETEIGLAPLSLSLGGFLTRDLALMFRTAGVSWFESVLDETAQIGSYFYGLALQYWLGNDVFLGGGLGLALLDDNFLLSSVNIESETGFTLTARFGYSFVTLEEHSFAVVLELFPAFYDPAMVLGTAINLQWQLL